MVHVVSRKALRDFAAAHADAGQALDDWFHVARRATWWSLEDVRRMYPQADFVGGLTVFNVKGNRYRLITRINYRLQRVYIRAVLTHAEYDRGDWKE